MRYSISLLITVFLLGLPALTTASNRTATPSIDIELLPDFLQPGEEYEIRYSTTEPGFVILYAIDTRGYINLLYPLSPDLDGFGEVLPNQEYSLPGVVAGVRTGRERVVALFTRNYIEIPEHRWEFLSNDPYDISEISYDLTRRTSGLSNYNLAVLQIGYHYQGATSPDYELPDRVEVVYVHLYTPDPWLYYSGYHSSWWWHYDRYWYPHRYRYWRVSWHAWYGPFYDPWYGPWHYSWYDPWYYHHHGHYAWGGGHHGGGYHHGGYNPSEPAPPPSPPRIPRDLDRRRTADAPAPDDGSRIVAIPAVNAVTQLQLPPGAITTPAVSTPTRTPKVETVRRGTTTNPESRSPQPAVTRSWHGKRKQTSRSATVVKPQRRQTGSQGTAITPKKSTPSGSGTKKNGNSGTTKKQDQSPTSKKAKRRN